MSASFLGLKGCYLGQIYRRHLTFSLVIKVSIVDCKANTPKDTNEHWEKCVRQQFYDFFWILPKATIGTIQSWNIAQRASLQSKLSLLHLIFISYLYDENFSYLLSLSTSEISEVSFCSSTSSSFIFKCSLYVWPVISSKGTIMVKIIQMSIILT